MEITGKIIAVLPERSGVSARTGAEWRCASYVLETLEQYPRKMNFDVFGVDRIQQFNIQVGETMVVSFDIDAHEYQGRWFNSIRASSVLPQTSPFSLFDSDFMTHADFDPRQPVQGRSRDLLFITCDQPPKTTEAKTI